MPRVLQVSENKALQLNEGADERLEDYFVRSSKPF